MIDAFGCGFVQSYGMTEAAQALTFLTADDHRLALGAGRSCCCLRQAAAGTDLQVIDGAGSPLPAGTPGEILARGPQLMSGYWRRPEATAHALRAAG